MKLSFCLYKYFPFGGLQQDCLSVLNTAVLRGHQVTLYTLSWEGAVPSGVELIEIPIRAMSNHSKYQKFAKQVELHCQKNPPDRLIGFNKIPNLDYYFAGDPCYVEKMQKKSMWPVTMISPRFQQLAYFESQVFSPHKKVKIFYLSEKEKIKFQKIYQTPDERFVRLPPGIDQSAILDAKSQFDKEKTRLKLGISKTQKMLLIVGSGFHIKGLDRAIEALASLPRKIQAETVLCVVGDSESHPFKQLAIQRGLIDKLIFLGGRRDVLQLMHAADLLIHPARNETGGKVLLEAALCGLPIITTAACGYSSYISDYNVGTVLPEPFSQELLNAALKFAMVTPEKQFSHEDTMRFIHEASISGLAEKFVDTLEVDFNEVSKQCP